MTSPSTQALQLKKRIGPVLDTIRYFDPKGVISSTVLHGTNTPKAVVTLSEAAYKKLAASFLNEKSGFEVLFGLRPEKASGNNTIKFSVAREPLEFEKIEHVFKYENEHDREVIGDYLFVEAGDEQMYWLYMQTNITGKYVKELTPEIGITC